MFARMHAECESIVQERTVTAGVGLRKHACIVATHEHQAQHQVTTSKCKSHSLQDVPADEGPAAVHHRGPDPAVLRHPLLHQVPDVRERARPGP